MRQGADPSRATNRGWTPLHLAAALNYSAVFEYLVSLPNVNVEEESYDRSTAESIATTMNNANILSIIDAHLASKAVRVHPPPLPLGLPRQMRQCSP